MHLRHFLRAGYALALALPTAAQTEPALAADQEAEFHREPAWRDFRAQVGGDWRVEWCAATGTPKAIWGSGLPLADWRENSLEEARRHARQLLRERADLLRLGASEFREVIGDRMGSTWVLVYDQYFRGLPVIGGRADVRVHMVGRVPMFGSRAWQIPAEFDTVPSLGAETARAIAWLALGDNPTGARQPRAAPAPRLVIWGDIGSTAPTSVQLAWEVAISNVDASGLGPIGRYYVDAHSGRVLHFTSDKHGFTATPPPAKGPAVRLLPATITPLPPPPPTSTTLTFMGWTRATLGANDPPISVPMAGLEIAVPGVGIRTTDANGQITVWLTTLSLIIVGNPDGRYHDQIQGPGWTASTTFVAPGAHQTIQLLSANSLSSALAHTNTSYWIDRTHEFCRSIFFASSALVNMRSIQPNVNGALLCNSYYANNTLNFNLGSSSCLNNNSAFSTFIAHEWGHGLDDQYGGISNNPGDGLGEAWGDIVAMYLVDDPTIGFGFRLPGVGVRTGLNTRQYTSLQPTTPEHDAGEVFMGFAWKLRERLAIGRTRSAAKTISNRIVLGSIVADATDQAAAVLEVYIADDNDGNLWNGTPHYLDIGWACFLHSLPRAPDLVYASGGYYGTGCGAASTAFYELSLGAAFDLGGKAMRLVDSGGYYTVQPGGTFVPPGVNATALALGDDAETTVQLNGSFPFLGGTTTSLVVCSNGFVSVATGNGIDHTPSAAEWLASTQPRWGSWCDFDPSYPGSGQVMFEQVGNIAYVTWDGVYTHANPAPQTWQLQFDLGTGDVTQLWLASNTANTPQWLTGYAGPAPNLDLGSMDISAALPATFQTNPTNRPPLSHTSTNPQVGTTLLLNASNYPPASPLGIQVISFVRHDPGIDLGAFGMPGCKQFTGNEVTSVVFPVNGQSSYAITLPYTGTYIGMIFHSQVYALAPGSNATGLVSSNGVTHRIGI